MPRRLSRAINITILESWRMTLIRMEDSLRHTGTGCHESQSEPGQGLFRPLKELDMMGSAMIGYPRSSACHTYYRIRRWAVAVDPGSKRI